jgi:hypothetical protein
LRWLHPSSGYIVSVWGGSRSCGDERIDPRYSPISRGGAHQHRLEQRVRHVILAFDGRFSEVFLFKTRHHADYAQDWRKRMVDVALATSAAPTIYRPLESGGYVSEAGEGWSDSRIIKALESSATTVYRTRQQLVEGGFEAVLSRKKRARPPVHVPPIFDGEKEARLIALACSQPPKGRARWTLRLLEDKVVELNIVDRASDSTIGRVLKNHFGQRPPVGVETAEVSSPWR